MGIDPKLLQGQCGRTLERIALYGVGERFEGKVRDNYIDTESGRRTICVTDRVSCFDVVVGTLPFKGQVLNQLAAFWFERTTEIAPNHLIAVPDPAVSVVHECRVIPVEFVVRGYLTGSSPTSIWAAYDAGERLYCGHRLRDGMSKHEPLPEPLLTPTTKAEKGQHDELISRADAIVRGLASEELYDRAAEIALALYAAGTRHAARQGLILVDTKYEMGLDAEGEIVLIDEVHTPDSSRYWYRDTYEREMADGRDPEAQDKEYLRRWLIEKGWRGDGPMPRIPDDVRCEAARRYIEAFERISGAPFEPSTEEPEARIRRHLSEFFGRNI